ALGLAPQATVARRVSGIYALGDDAFRRALARGVEETLAAPDVMVAELKRGGRAFEEAAQPLLALEQRRQGEVFAVEEQQVEDEIEDLRRAPFIGGGLQRGEGGGAVRRDR